MYIKSSTLTKALIIGLLGLAGSCAETTKDKDKNKGTKKETKNADDKTAVVKPTETDKTKNPKTVEVEPQKTVTPEEIVKPKEELIVAVEKSRKEYRTEEEKLLTIKDKKSDPYKTQQSLVQEKKKAYEKAREKFSIELWAQVDGLDIAKLRGDPVKKESAELSKAILDTLSAEEILYVQEKYFHGEPVEGLDMKKTKAAFGARVKSVETAAKSYAEKRDAFAKALRENQIALAILEDARKKKLVEYSNFRVQFTKTLDGYKTAMESLKKIKMFEKFSTDFLKAIKELRTAEDVVSKDGSEENQKAFEEKAQLYKTAYKMVSDAIIKAKKAEVDTENKFTSAVTKLVELEGKIKAKDKEYKDAVEELEALKTRAPAKLMDLYVAMDGRLDFSSASGHYPQQQQRFELNGAESETPEDGGDPQEDRSIWPSGESLAPFMPLPPIQASLKKLVDNGAITVDEQDNPTTLFRVCKEGEDQNCKAVAFGTCQAKDGTTKLEKCQKIQGEFEKLEARGRKLEVEILNSLKNELASLKISLEDAKKLRIQRYAEMIAGDLANNTPEKIAERKALAAQYELERFLALSEHIYDTTKNDFEAAERVFASKTGTKSIEEKEGVNIEYNKTNKHESLYRAIDNAKEETTDAAEKKKFIAMVYKTLEIAMDNYYYAEVEGGATQNPNLAGEQRSLFIMKKEISETKKQLAAAKKTYEAAKKALDESKQKK